MRLITFFPLILISLCRAIQNGSNFLAEGFLFSVAAALIIAETWRSSRSQTRQREGVDDRIDELEVRVADLIGLVEALGVQLEGIGKELQIEGTRYVIPSDRVIYRLLLGYRNEEISRVLLKVVDIGIQGGWAEFKEHPIQLPPFHLDHVKGLPDPTKAPQSSSDRLRNLSAVVDQYEKVKASRADNTGDNIKVSKLPEKEVNPVKK
jgi:optic atrophy 3 protein